MKKIYTFFIVILPMISVYQSPIIGVDLATFLAVLLSFYIIFTNKGKAYIIKPLAIFLMYLIISTLVSLLLQETYGYTLIFFRTGKYIVLIFIILFIGNRELFIIEYGLKILRMVTIIAVIYIFVQTIMYRLFDILLPNGILSLLTYDAYAKLDYVSIAKFFYRPSSFFIEPSSFAQYALLYLAYSIFGIDNTKICYNWKHAIFVSTGIILSGSGQGILLVFCLWIIWVLKKVITPRIALKKLILSIGILGFCIIFMPLLLQSEWLAKPLSRVFTDNVAGGGNAFLGRMGGYSYFDMLPGIFKLIGKGYGNVPAGVYFNSASYTLYCSGIIGVIIVLYIFYGIYKKGIGFQRTFMLIYFALFLGATVFTAVNICFYFSFVYNYKISEKALKTNPLHENNYYEKKISEVQV